MSSTKPDRRQIALEKAKRYVQWSQINNRMPTISKNSSETEKKLASWYKMYKNKSNKVKNYPEVDVFLQNNLGSNVLQRNKTKKTDERDDAALERAKDYVQFMRTYARAPRSKNATKFEKSLHNWFYSFKKSKKENYPKTYVYLNENMKGVDWTDTRTEKALRKAMEYASWVLSHYKEKPSTVSKDLYEKKLAIWYNNYLRKRNSYQCVDEYFKGMRYSNGKPLSILDMNDIWHSNKPKNACETRKKEYWEENHKISLTPIESKIQKEKPKKLSGRPLQATSQSNPLPNNAVRSQIVQQQIPIFA